MLGIGGGFIVLLICFVNFASQIFYDLESSNKPSTFSMREGVQDFTERLDLYKEVAFKDPKNMLKI